MKKSQLLLTWLVVLSVVQTARSRYEDLRHRRWRLHREHTFHEKLKRLEKEKNYFKEKAKKEHKMRIQMQKIQKNVSKKSKFL